MRVLITGGNGGIGKVVTQHLVQRGWDVRVIDLADETDLPGAEYIQCDIMDYDDLRNAMRGCEAVIHLAAIPTPATMPGYDVFQINATGTYKVFEAAAAEGIRRIAQASSINALGCAWGAAEIVAEYFPIDEQHPTHTTDPYSFSKEMVERIGAYYWRREGISSVALRLPWVWTHRPTYLDEIRAKWQADRALIDAFAALSVSERQAQLADVKQQAVAFRTQRRMEYSQSERPSTQKKRLQRYESSLWRTYTFDRFNFWTLVDVRDAAQAFEKGLTADYQGSHALFINAAQNWLGVDTETLLHLFFPDVSQRKKPVPSDESLISIDAARELIGFEPEYTPDILTEGKTP